MSVRCCLREPNSYLTVLSLLCGAILSGAVAAHAAQVQKGRPYSEQEIVRLLKGDVTPTRVAELVRERGIDFQVTTEVEKELRRAGASNSLLSALRRAAPPSEGRAAVGSVGRGRLTGAIARNHGELLQLAQRTDRDYFEFRLDHVGAKATLGSLQLVLVETDVKHGLYTLNLYFDGKRITIRNEAIGPFFFYMQGASTALEFVVNQVHDGSIAGYVSAPKSFLRGATSVLSGDSESSQKSGRGATLDTPEEHCRRGDAFLAAFQWNNAIKEYQEALRQKPDYGDAKRKLAEALKFKENASQR